MSEPPLFPFGHALHITAEAEVIRNGHVVVDDQSDATNMED